MTEEETDRWISLFGQAISFADKSAIKSCEVLELLCCHIQNASYVILYASQSYMIYNVLFSPTTHLSRKIISALMSKLRLDGASNFMMWRHITLPFMSPHLLFASVMGLIGVSSFFAQPMVMTNGGPADSTRFFAQYLFQNAFQFFKMGYACAMAWALAVVLVFMTWLLFKGSARHIYYAGD